MKTEELNQKCPKCGCQDKTVSQTLIKETFVDMCYIPHIPSGVVGIIRCTKCGHIFEYCKDQKLKQEVKKLDCNQVFCKII
ncbi:MAG: TIGR04165 family Cys-rich peptide [Euryarchaeota archaeon]|jgi:Cys-rich peptide (TIGR04165 family)|uniref:TIGR04165 family Cys-rich peptide n=1 Tax=Methanobacterium sp. MZD130B TaxID=3394378 RepID=UPI0017621586|nr:TIGR04165 family Cys-rich peptide [Euryarchaeota archaeon]HHT19189.1 TIGR04165 family Cys-rich peptide [Methanobacterium sp.]